jgi:MFS family permease
VGWKDRFEVLRARDLRLVFAATAISQLGDGVVTVAVAFAVLDLTGSATDLGLVMVCRTVALLGSLLVGGVIADRVSRRRVMIAADSARFVSQVVIGVLIVSGHAAVWEIALSQAVLGAASGFFEPASSGLLPAVADRWISESYALQGIVSSIGGIAGPAIGGALVVGIGPGSAMLVDGATYAASALLLFGVRAAAARAPAIADRDRQPFLTELRGGYTEVRGRRWVWITMIVFATTNALAAAYFVLGPVIAKHQLGGPGAWAVLGTAFAVGALIGGTALLQIKPRRPMLVGSLVAIALVFPTLLIAIPAPLIVIAIFQIASGIAAIVANTMWWLVLQQNIPPEKLSRVTSYEWFGTLALQPIGYALVGPLASRIGTSSTLYLCGGLSLLVTLSLLAVSDVRNLENKARTNIRTTAP